MIEFVLALLVALRVFFRTRRDTALEILALRHQVAVLKRNRPRPPLNSVDRLFWATLRGIWFHWVDVLIIVKPETRRQLASHRLSAVLALAVPPARRAAENH